MSLDPVAGVSSQTWPGRIDETLTNAHGRSFPAPREMTFTFLGHAAALQTFAMLPFAQGYERGVHVRKYVATGVVSLMFLRSGPAATRGPGRRRIGVRPTTSDLARNCR